MKRGNDSTLAGWKILCRFPGQTTYQDARIDFAKHKIPKRIKGDEVRQAKHVFQSVISGNLKCDFKLVKEDAVMATYSAYKELRRG